MRVYGERCEITESHVEASRPRALIDLNVLTTRHYEPYSMSYIYLIRTNFRAYLISRKRYFDSFGARFCYFGALKIDFLRECAKISTREN